MAPFRTPAGLVLLPTVPIRPVPRALLASVLRVLSDALGVREAHLTEAVPAPGGAPQRVLWLFTGGGSDPGAVPRRIARDRRVELVDEVYDPAGGKNAMYSALLPNSAPDPYPHTLIVTLPDRESTWRRELRALGCRVTPQYPHLEAPAPLPPPRAWKLEDDGQPRAPRRGLRAVSLVHEPGAGPPEAGTLARERLARRGQGAPPSLVLPSAFLLIAAGVGLLVTFSSAREARRQAGFDAYDARFGALERRVESLRSTLCARQETPPNVHPARGGETWVFLGPGEKAAGLRDLARIEHDLNAVPVPPPGYRRDPPGNHVRRLISSTRAEVQDGTLHCPVWPNSTPAGP